jgi:hypothetical protein
VCVRRLLCCPHNKTDGTTAKNTNEGQNIDEEIGVKTVQAAPLEGKQRPCPSRPNFGGIACTSFVQDRQCNNSEPRSRDYFCNGKTICVTYFEYVSVALGI